MKREREREREEGVKSKDTVRVKLEILSRVDV